MLSPVLHVILLCQQVGATAEEFSAVVEATARLAQGSQGNQEQQKQQQHVSHHRSQQLTPASCSPVRVAGPESSSTSTASGDDSNGLSTKREIHAAAAAMVDKSDDAATAAGALLMELSHLPCFLLMEFVAGPKLKDSGAALMVSSIE
jgi:hypothetical protein